MDLSYFHHNFAVIDGNKAYEGDLGERFHAIVNQDTFVEVCAISDDGLKELHHIGHIAPLSEHVYDLAEFKHALRGEGIYFVLDTEDDVRSFLGEVGKQMVFERP